jgi:hypothetical protein
MMTRLTVLLLVTFAAACRGDPILAPAPSSTPQQYTPPSPPTVSSVRDVMVGERVEDVFGDGLTIHPGEHHFFVTAPSSGTLVVTLSWNPLELGTLLMLKLDDRVYMPTRPGWSPVVGRLRVEAGKRYLIAVGLAGADWLPQDPFVLTSVLGP